MKCWLTLVLLLFCMLLCSLAQENDYRKDFVMFQQQYGRFYSTLKEYNTRFSFFVENIKRADALNVKSANSTIAAKFGITKWMDMSPEEFRSTILMTKTPPLPNSSYVASQYHNDPTLTNKQLPYDFDWRNTPGVVTPVYNQGQCGSCWAFSATENIESRWALAGHAIQSLSMQQIVSCDTSDSGCSGGLPSRAYDYVYYAGGQDTYASYPYTGTDGSCQFNSANVYARINQWQYATTNGNEEEMAAYLVSYGPLSVCVDAEAWQYYQSGVVLASQCGTSIDHCVNAEGYASGSLPYWIIRNSWSTDWGQAGYIYLAFGTNTCGVAEIPTSSVI